MSQSKASPVRHRVSRSMRVTRNAFDGRESKTINKLHEQLIVLREELSRTELDRHSLTLQLNQYNYAKPLVYKLIVVLHKKVLAFLANLDSPHSRLKAPRLSMPDGEAAYPELAARAYEYDQRALRESRVISDGLGRAAYHIALSVDRLGVSAAKWALRSMKAIKRGLRKGTSKGTLHV